MQNLIKKTLVICLLALYLPINSFGLTSNEKAEIQVTIGQTVNSAAIFSLFAIGLGDKTDPLSEFPVIAAAATGGSIGLYSSIVLFEEPNSVNINNTQGLNSSIFWNNLWSFNLSNLIFFDQRIFTSTSLINLGLSTATFFNLNRLNVSPEKTTFVNMAGLWGITFTMATALVMDNRVFARQSSSFVSLLGSVSLYSHRVKS